MRKKRRHRLIFYFLLLLYYYLMSPSFFLGIFLFTCFLFFFLLVLILVPDICHVLSHFNFLKHWWRRFLCAELRLHCLSYLFPLSLSFSSSQMPSPRLEDVRAHIPVDTRRFSKLHFSGRSQRFFCSTFSSFLFFSIITYTHMNTYWGWCWTALNKQKWNQPRER